MAAFGVDGEIRGTQREGSHGWSRESQVEGKGRVETTKIMPHQHQVVDWGGCMGAAPSTVHLGGWRQETATY